MPDLISEWRAAREEWAAANKAGKPVQACNRIMDRIWDLGHEIAAHPDMHEAITALCELGQDPDVRPGAALVREHRDVRGAANTPGLSH